MVGSIRVVGRTSPERRCVYCRGGAGDLRACDACGALNHAGCRAELGRCTSLGCQGLQAAAAREGAITAPPGLLTPLWVTAAGHLALLVVTTAAAVALGALMATHHVAWFQARGLLTAALVLPATGFPLALLFSLPWLLGLRERVARARGLLLAPRPRAARLEVVERRQVLFNPRGRDREVIDTILVLTPGAGRPVEWPIGAMLGVPEWVADLPAQEVTLYGETDDPMLVELSDGRLLLLFRG